MFGVEPICTVLQVAPSTYYAAKRRPVCRRRLRDAELEVATRRVFDANYQVYGAQDLAATQPGRDRRGAVRPGSPEAIRHTMFRDWLRTHPDDRARYADAKRSAADVSTAAGEAVMDYNLRKQPVIREILDEMFRAHGMLNRGRSRRPARRPVRRAADELSR